MCQICRNTQVHFLFDWPTGLCDHAKRYALADVVSLAEDILAAPVEHSVDELRLSACGPRGLALILGAVEQALRFDVDQITPATQEG